VWRQERPCPGRPDLKPGARRLQLTSGRQQLGPRFARVTPSVTKTEPLLVSSSLEGQPLKHGMLFKHLKSERGNRVYYVHEQRGLCCHCQGSVQYQLDTRAKFRRCDRVWQLKPLKQPQPRKCSAPREQHRHSALLRRSAAAARIQRHFFFNHLPAHG